MFDFSEANCLDADPEMFFADDEENPNDELVNRAKIKCASCPIRVACLNKAIEDDLEGVWGGTTTFERRVRENRTRKNYVPIPRKVNAKQLTAGNSARQSKAIAEEMQILPEALVKIPHKIDGLTRVIIEARLANPEKTLAQLADFIDPPISRDIVSGRIRRVKKWMNEEIRKEPVNQ